MGRQALVPIERPMIVIAGPAVACQLNTLGNPFAKGCSRHQAAGIFDDHAFEYVPQFPDVSRPGIIGEQFHGIGGESRRCSVVLFRELQQEMIDQ